MKMVNMVASKGDGVRGRKGERVKSEINTKFKAKMAIEIERKYLVKGNFKHLATRNIEITQYYISIDPDKTIRLRIADDIGFLTIKNRNNNNPIERGEWEYKIPVQDAYEMIRICLPGKIVKTRYIISTGKHNFEVDVFHGKNEGLIIAEIELLSVDEPFEKPEWLGEEVTGLPKYYNANLIKD